MTPAEVLLPCPDQTQVGEASMTKEAEALCITNSEQRGLPPDPTKMVVHTAKKERRAPCGSQSSSRRASALGQIHTMTNQPIRDQMDEADLIVHNAKVTTLQDNGSQAVNPNILRAESA